MHRCLSRLDQNHTSRPHPNFQPTCAICTMGSYASLSVCLDWTKIISKKSQKIIHISRSITVRNMKHCSYASVRVVREKDTLENNHDQCVISVLLVQVHLELLVADYTLRKIYVSKLVMYCCCDRQDSLPTSSCIF